MEVKAREEEATLRLGSKPKCRELITYTCQKCSKLDLQVSMCLQVINDFMNKYEGGYTDSLDDMDPIVKRLFLERGYEERRRRVKSPQGSPKRHKSKPQLSGDGESNSNFSVSFYNLDKTPNSFRP